MVFRSFPLLIVAALAQLVPLRAVTAQEDIQLTPRARRCATDVPSDFRRELNEIYTARFNVSNPNFNARSVPLTIVVQFIHLTDGTNGNVTEDQRKKQIKVLNDAYKNANVKFDYDENQVIVKNKASWFHMGHGTSSEREAKEELQKDPKKFLNFYTCDPPGGLLGWATFPWDLASEPKMDGIVVAFDTLPDGASSKFNEGDTGTHEVGHWLGLYHTFQDPCTPENDRVADTLSHTVLLDTPDHTETNNAVCPDQRFNNSPFTEEQKKKLDDVAKNFMNYVDDVWMDRFTPEQDSRVKHMLMVYRADLFLAGPNAGATSNRLPFQRIQLLP